MIRTRHDGASRCDCDACCRKDPSRATVAAVPRQGRPPAAESADRLSRAAAIVLAEPGVSGAELARRVGVTPSRGGRLLAEVRASIPVVEVPPAPIGPGRVVRIPARVLARLEQLPGSGTIEQIEAALDAAEREARRGVVR